MLVVPEVAAEAGEGGGQAPLGQGAVDGEEAIGEVNPDEAVEEGDGSVSFYHRVSNHDHDRRVGKEDG